MKLGFLSDIHLDDNQQYFEASLLDILIEKVKSEKLDYLFISGDISSDDKETLRVVKKINEEIDTSTFFVPGNHDVWRKDKSSIDSIFNLNANKYAVTDRVVEINDEWAVVGAFPWYDYSLDTEGMPKDFYRISDMWPDSKFTDWQMADPEFTELQLQRTSEIIQDIPSEKKIILVQHFVPHEDFVIIKEGNRNWNLCNAFMGTKCISDLCFHYPNIKTVTFGHTHYRFGITEKFDAAFFGNPLGYRHEWDTGEFEKELETCLLVKRI